MTVISELCAVERSWTGVETLFDTGFVALDATHVRVSVGGTPLTRGTHYTSQLSVSRIMQVLPLPGMVAAPATLLIERNTPATQANNLVNGDGWDMEIFERELDGSAMRDAESRRLAGLARDAAATAVADATAAVATADDALAQIENVVAQMVPDNSVTNARLADMPAGTVKGRRQADGDGDPQDLSGSDMLDLVGKIANDRLVDIPEATLVGRASGSGTGARQALTKAQVKAILGGAGIEAVATRAELKALPTATYSIVQLTEAGREGVFRWVADNFAALIAADVSEGLFIKADDTASSAGAWVRVYSGRIDPRWFGIATANLAATNTTFLNNAVATVKAMGNGVISFPNGQFLMNALAPIDQVNDVIIESRRGRKAGFVGGTVFSWQNATGDCIVFTNAQHSGVRDIYHRHDVRRTGGFTVRLADSCFHPFFEGRIDYAWNAVHIFGCSEAKVDLVARYTYGNYNVLVEGSVSYQIFGCTAKVASDNPYPITGDGPRKSWSNGLAVSVNDIVRSPTSGFIYQVTGAGNLGATEPNTIGGTTGPDGYTATITNGTATLKFVCQTLNHIEIGNYAYSIRLAKGTHLLNGYRGLITSDAANSAASRPKWIYLEQTEIDHSYWNCAELFRGESVYLMGAWLGSSLTGNGLSIDLGFAGDISVDAACRIAGNWLHGIYSGSGYKNLRINGPQVLDNSQAAIGTYHGIMIDGSTRFQIVIATCIGARQGFGIFINTGSDYYAVVAPNVGGNATGGVSNVPGTLANRREVLAVIN